MVTGVANGYGYICKIDNIKDEYDWIFNIDLYQNIHIIPIDTRFTSDQECEQLEPKLPESGKMFRVSHIDKNISIIRKAKYTIDGKVEEYKYGYSQLLNIIKNKMIIEANHCEKIAVKFIA